LTFPRVDPEIFDHIASAFAGRSQSETGFSHHGFLALVLLPALDRMGVGFDELALRVPFDPEARFQATDWVDGSLWLIGRRGPDGLVEVRAAQVNFGG